MSRKLLFIIAALGLIAGVVGAYLFAMRRPSQPPVFQPVSNPFGSGIYANGIIESDQASGENVSIYPEVPGPVTKVFVVEGQQVKAGDSLISIDDSVERPLAQQQGAQADAARAALEALRAQPRPEVLEVVTQQVALAEATWKNARDTFEKKKAAFASDPGTLSKDDLDTAENVAKIAEASLGVARRQLALTKAGAWDFDVRAQESQYQALSRACAALNALLAKYVIKAPVDGIVLSINAALGSYVSAQGAYDTYTQGFLPIVVMGGPGSMMAVRVYIDEILVHRLTPAPKAVMFVRGTEVKVPLEYVRTTPYVSPKIELSNQRAERVDVRVLPMIFRFERPKDVPLYLGQIVDVYVEEARSPTPSPRPEVANR